MFNQKIISAKFKDNWNFDLSEVSITRTLGEYRPPPSLDTNDPDRHHLFLVPFRKYPENFI